MSQDWVAVLEAIYEVERPLDGWLGGLVERARSFAPDDATTLAYTYDVSSPSRLTTSPVARSGEAPALLMIFESMASMEVSPAFIDATYRSLRAGSQRETLPALTRLFQGMVASDETPAFVDATYRSMLGDAQPESADPTVEQFMAFTGFADMHLANGIDTDGHGVWLGLCLPTFEPLTAARREALERTAAHLAMGWRLRRKLAASTQSVTERAEAVLTPDGRMQHAVGAATETDAREALSTAVRAMDAARTRERRGDPALGLVEWSGLVARRWSLVEVLERDGKRFLVAEENKPADSARLLLTAREHEVAALAALKLSNKLIAYELGISPATVGVLLHRAMKKLGLEDRAALHEKLREPPPG